MYLSKDFKSVLIAKPQTHISRKSKYPNSKTSSTDRYYNQANLHLKFMCRDARHLNFICHGSEASDFLSFDPEWSPMKMSKLIEDVMTDDNLALHISTPVIKLHIQKINSICPQLHHCMITVWTIHFSGPPNYYILSY